MKIKALRDKAARLQSEELALRTEAEELYDTAETEQDGVLTDEQSARADAIDARLKAIGAEQRTIAGRLANAERAQELERAGRLPAHAVTTGQRDMAAERPFDSFGEMLQSLAVAQSPAGVEIAGHHGGTIDPRLYKAGPSGLSVNAPGEGGVLVRKDWSTDLLSRGQEQSLLLPLCDRKEIGPNSDALEMPRIDETSRATGSRWGGVRVYRRKEAATVNASKPSLDMFECRLEDLMAICYATDRLLRDAVALQSVIETAFPSEFAFTVDDELIRGNGAGEMTGVLNAACKVAQAAETGQVADTILHANLSKMWTRMYTRGKGNAVWLYNDEIEPQFDEMTIPAGTGAVEPRIVRQTEAGDLRIKGRPTMRIEQCEELGTEGDIILADMSQMCVVTKGGLAADTSMHVRFIYGEMTYRFMYRINARPKWKTSLTRYQGANTQSPFVTLATRS